MMRTIAITCAAVALAGICAIAQSADYALSLWPCGVIVWPEAVPDYAEHFVQRLTDAAATAFGFWGYDMPVIVETSYNEAKTLRISDPATDDVRVIPPLQWTLWEIPPVVVFAFPGEGDMRLAMGNTNLYGAFWRQWPMNQAAFPHADSWIWTVGSGYRNMVCASSAEDSILIHEFAHWFTYEWCSQRGIAVSSLPNYIIEGIAEATCAAEEDANDAVYTRLQAVSWAQNKCLAGSIQGVMQYPVGQSLVSHLVETLGPGGFLGTLRDWSMCTTAMIDMYEGGWRESLGLPARCPE